MRTLVDSSLVSRLDEELDDDEDDDDISSSSSWFSYNKYEFSSSFTGRSCDTSDVKQNDSEDDEEPDEVEDDEDPQ